MINLPRLPRPRRGEPIKAEHLIALADAVEKSRVTTVTGMEVRQGPGGLALVAGIPIVLVKAVTGVGGVPAGTAGGLTPGSADVTLCAWDGTAVAAGTQTVKAYNFTTAAVGASKPVTLGLLAYGIWEILLEPCS